MADNLDPLTKGDVTRTPGTPTERVQMLAQGWKPAAKKPAPKPTPPKQ